MWGSTRSPKSWDSRNSEYLHKEGSNCDNRLRSGKPRHLYCRTFESANTGSTCPWHQRLRQVFMQPEIRIGGVKLCELVFLVYLYLDILIP
jgi:hypothetical protein